MRHRPKEIGFLQRSTEAHQDHESDNSPEGCQVSSGRPRSKQHRQVGQLFFRPCHEGGFRPQNHQGTEPAGKSGHFRLAIPQPAANPQRIVEYAHHLARRQGRPLIMKSAQRLLGAPDLNLRRGSSQFIKAPCYARCAADDRTLTMNHRRLSLQQPHEDGCHVSIAAVFEIGIGYANHRAD